jgi:hypothetical protein
MNNSRLYDALGSLDRRGYAAIPFGFAVVFLLSGVYEIPFLPVDATWVSNAKKILFVCLMVLMGYSLRWREAIRGPFSLFCGLWALLHIGHWAYRAEYDEVYLQRLIQIVFIWILVNVVIQQKKDSERFLGLRSFFSPLFFPVACLFLALFAFHPEITKALSNGMGNGRVSFSIWLSQLVFLTFLLSLGKSEQTVLKAFVLATPILVLQTFTGGRTGLLASLALWFYFSFREGGLRLSIMGGVYLAVLIPLSAAISPLPDIYPGTSIFRVIDLPQGDGWLAWLDRLSSYRLGIMTSALSTLDADTRLLGKGVMNFKGWAIGYPWDVHNIYIRALGETGVIGLAALVALLFLPFRTQARQEDIVAAKVYCGIFLMVGMVHPDLLTTAISTCMIFWLSYAEALRYRKSGADT